MTKDELKKLDEKLAAEEREIISQLRGVATENPAIKGDFEPIMPNYDDNEKDMDDSINEATDFDRNLAMQQQLETRLKDVRNVRGQIAQGTYGTCSNCRSTIPPERLSAMPSASLCITCASKV